jgi:hypothetical protein
VTYAPFGTGTFERALLRQERWAGWGRFFVPEHTAIIRNPERTESRTLYAAGERSTARRTSDETAFAPRSFAISRLVLDPKNAFDDSCRPFTEIPAWWSGFVFHVLNARQITLYLYLCMLLDTDGLCAPTVEQIRQDLGLSSSIVFGAIGGLEAAGFILRRRTYLASLRSRRNVYQRPSCEFTVLRLLHIGKIDGELRAVPGDTHEMSGDCRQLKVEWLQGLLREEFARYAAAATPAKAQILIRALSAQVDDHPR